MSSRSANSRPRVGGPDTRHETTERRLLDSTAELISAGASWHSLGIGQITTQAGISRTAFYDFFGSKNELLGHLVRGLFDELAEQLRETLAVDDEATPSLQRLRPVLAVLVQFSTTHGHVYRALLDASGEDQALESLLHELSATCLKAIASAITDARAQDPAVPSTPPAAPLAQVLLVMSERTLLLLLRIPDAAAHAPLVETLATTWERAIFGRSR